MSKSIFIILVLLLSGCAKGNGRGGYEANLTEKTVQPQTMMVATPLPQTLYVVFDPAKVADSFEVVNSKNSMTGFRPFFGDGLKKALAPYFQDVQIVEPSFAFPADAHAVADVKLDLVEARNLDVGGLRYVTLNMQWSFAVRPHDAAEYLFSFSGVGTSDQTYARLEEGAQQMLKSSLAGLLNGWTEKDVYKAFKAHAASSASTGAPSDVQDL